MVAVEENDPAQIISVMHGFGVHAEVRLSPCFCVRRHRDDVAGHHNAFPLQDFALTVLALGSPHRAYDFEGVGHD